MNVIDIKCTLQILCSIKIIKSYVNSYFSLNIFTFILKSIGVKSFKIDINHLIKKDSIHFDIAKLNDKIISLLTFVKL